MYIGKKPPVSPALSRIEPDLEDATVRAMTHGVYRFSRRHPFWYGLIGFVLGGGLVGVFVLTTYLRWTLFAVDVDFATELYQLVGGGLGGGVGGVVLAFLYAGSLRNLVDPAGI